MPYQVATAHVPVVPTFQSWRRNVQAEATSPAMERAGQTAGDKVAAGFERGASRLGRVIKGAVVTAAGAAVAAGTVGVRTAAQMETANIAFTTMLGSAKKAQTFLTQLANFAAKTPFELPELQTAAQSLVSIGIKANKVIPIMTTLGNVTAGMGTGSEGIKRATVAIQQMNAAQKISAEDLNQLRDAGIPVYELLSKAMGKSTKEVANLAQKGKLGKDALDKMMAALESGKGLERFNGMMEKQSASLAGLWSTLKDTFSGGMAQAIQPVLPLLKDGLTAAIAKVTEVMPKLQKALVGVVGLFNLIVKGDYTGALRRAFGWEEDDPTVDRILKVRDAAIGLFNLLLRGDYNGALRRAFGWEEDDPTVDRLLGIRQTVIDVFKSIRTWIGSVNWDSVRDQIGGLFTQIKKAVSGVDFKAIGDRLGEVFTKLAPALQDTASSLPAIGPTLDLFGKAAAFAADHVDVLAKALPYLVAGFIAYKTAQAANSVIGRDSLLGFGAQLATTITLTVANRTLARSFATVTTAQASALATTVAATGAENVSLLTRIRSAAATAAKTVAEKAAAIATKAYTAGQWLLNAALTANPIGLIILLLVALGAAVVLAWKKSDTFRAIVTGAWNGIKAAAFATVSWIRDTAWPWLRQAFDWIAAKAKWLWEKGVKAPLDNFRRGIDVIRDAIGAVKDAIGSKWAGLVDAISGPVGKVLSWVSRYFITPINNMLSKVGIGFRLPTFSLPSTSTGRSTQGGITRATGGVLPGWSPGKDNMHWWSPTLGSLALSGGEAIMRPEWTRAVGSGFVDRMNALARSGGVSAVRKGLGYAGGGILGKIGGFASNVADLVTNPAKLLRTLLPDVGQALNGNVFGRAMSGLVGKLIDSLASKIRDGFGSSAPAGAGVQRWSAVALRALQMAGESAGLLPLLLRRMQVESGGNPAAINRWDINARNGVPSQGLMQVIPPTFAAYAGALRGRGILDPLANIFAAIRYTRSRYGGNFARAWSGTAGYAGGGLVPTGPPLLFDTGGVLPPTRPGEFIPVQNRTGKPELVLNGRQSDQLRGPKYVFENCNFGYDPQEVVEVLDERDHISEYLKPPTG